MPHSDPLPILVINDMGEEIKLVTVSFRAFFPGCRVEAVYSPDEALQWVSRARWHLILADERLLSQHSTPILPRLRELAPTAAIVLQTDRSDAAAALDALQAGADFLLFKKSPAFLTELVLYARDALEKRELRMALERTQERHGRLIDTLGDVLYELDAEGRFVYLSPSVTSLLGFTQDELTGAPYSTVVPPDQLEHVRYRFNDRRTGPRAARRIEVELARKPSEGGLPNARVRAELSAKGLYDPQRQFVGTLGLLRDISTRREQEETVERLQRELSETIRAKETAQRVSTLAKHLQQPLSAVLSQTQQLFSAVQEVNLDQQVHTLLLHATEAVRQGAVLAETARETVTSPPTLNEVLDDILAATHPPLLTAERVERSYAADLPPFTGDRATAADLFRTLLAHTQRYAEATGVRHRFRIRTLAVTNARQPGHPFRIPSISPTEVEVRIEETSTPAAEPGPPLMDTADLFQAYALVHRLGGRLELFAPVGGLFSMTVYLPTTPGAAPLPSAALPPPVDPSSFVDEASQPGTAASPIVDQPPVVPSPSPLVDRRQAARVSVQVPARITFDNATREGVVIDLSLKGAGLSVEGTLPIFDGQPVYVIIRTPVSMLELHALADSRGPALSSDTAHPSSALAFRFPSVSEIEERVLASLIEAAGARTLALSVEGLVTLPDDALDDMPVAEHDRGGNNHRETLRIRMALPVRIEAPSLDAATPRPLGLVINMSRGGACLQMKHIPGTMDETLSLHFSAMESFVAPRTHEPEAPEAILTARIVWTAPDPTAPSALKPSAEEPAQQVGIRFVQLPSFAEREINRVLAQYIGSSMDLEGIAGRSSIISARRECRNARQQVIAVTDDHARHQTSPGTPIVIIVPGFGKVQTDYLPLSYFFAANRLRVIRYDHTNHVGHSDGDVLQTALRSMQVDLEQVLEFVRHTWPTAPLAVLSEDVGARVALKTIAQTRTSGSLLLVDPVLDLRNTLAATYRHDLVTDHRQNIKRGVANLWGLNVNLDQFVGDALAGGYVDVSTSAADLAALAASPLMFKTRAPVDSVAGSLDASLHALGRTSAVIPLHTEIACVSGRFDERHVASYRTLLKRLAASFSETHRLDPPRDAPRQEIHRQRTLEQERNRIRHHVSQATREALWTAHLAQQPQLNALHDYWALWEHLSRELLPLDSGMTIVDVGCGRGDLPRSILTNQVYRSAHRSGRPDTPLQYLGLEQSRESLAAADLSLSLCRRELTDTFSSVPSLAHLLDAHWMELDWGAPAWFQEGPPARMVFHLSLAFSPAPLAILRRAIAALGPHGRIVMTCFQPHTDLSSLFRRHLHTTDTGEFQDRGHILLHYLGRLREALRHGLLHCYDRHDLSRLLIHAGASPLRILPILDGQLLLAVAGNGKSTG